MSIRPYFRRHLVLSVPSDVQACAPTRGLDIYRVTRANVHKAEDFKPAGDVRKFVQFLREDRVGVYAALDGRVVGHAWLYRHDGGGDVVNGYFRVGPGQALIHHCNVAEGARGQGLFASMIAALVAEARRTCPDLNILVDAALSNRSSLSALQRMGCTPLFKLQTFSNGTRLLLERRRSLTIQQRAHYFPRATLGRRTQSPPSEQSCRVVHVSSAHRTSDVRIHLREAATLAGAGHDVTLVAIQHEIDLPATGVKLVGIRPRPRILRMTLGGASAVLHSLRTRATIFHIHDPELIWAIIPLRFLGKCVIYDAHEDLPTQVLSKPYLNRATRPAARMIARALVRTASLSNFIVAATDTIGNSFPADKAVVVRNYPIIRAADAKLPDLLDRPLAVAYLGVMAHSRGTIPMIDAFASPYFPTGWKAVVAGPTSPPTLLQELTERAGWARVDYRGFVSTDVARDLLHECRVGVVTLRRSEAYLDSLPTKMFEYMAAGMPVIASDFPRWRSIIEEFQCGILVDEEDPHAIAAAVHKYASDPELMREHGENGRAAVRSSLNWNNEARKLTALYSHAARCQ